MRNQQSSSTAQSVAINAVLLLYESAFGKLVPSDTVPPTRWFLQGVPGLTANSSTLSNCASMCPCMQRIEQWKLPGITIHNLLRKLWFEDKVRDALDSGCSQIVVIGPGFDTLAYRLHQEFPAVRWWEIDHPATQQIKRIVLERHGGIKANLKLLPVDFTQQTLADVLTSTAHYNRHAVSLFVVEGLFMYLTEAKVREFLQTIHKYSGSGSGLIGTVLAEQKDGQKDSQLAIPEAKRTSKLACQHGTLAYRRAFSMASIFR
ncbi:class I SAM-dependent methyltransferase [Iningainema tapete]|uniref:S-adenosyl-L-methionine-dependent methyltransferase n=1 Tax=Iningainema tapete BLCC-T55 TaxID=2748662 RepID=A0A8J7BXQ3_9CYAN|nr:class I SAM-dependent methyltransferase [Iningainema tapete]MBD2773343.1 class I SAM-dependent methyltransferase [Iningainema tapete BLCC-T55]